MGAGWIALIAVAAVAALAVAWLELVRNREVVSEIDVRNAGGSAGTALMVYHPGRSGFYRQVADGFAKGLISRGWRVEATTASGEAPSDLSAYDLLVLGGPTYFFTPNRPIRRYLSRLGDLKGKPTVTIITAMGVGQRSTAVMERRVREANGNLVRALLLYWMRPNDDDNYVDTPQNKALAAAMATEAAKQIALPNF
jgi:hypothetical protein